MARTLLRPGLSLGSTKARSDRGHRDPRTQRRLYRRVSLPSLSSRRNQGRRLRSVEVLSRRARLAPSVWEESRTRVPTAAATRRHWSGLRPAALVGYLARASSGPK